MIDMKILVILRKSFLRIRCKQTLGKSHYTYYISIYDYYDDLILWLQKIPQMKSQVYQQHKDLSSMKCTRNFTVLMIFLDTEILAGEQTFKINKMFYKFTSQIKKHFDTSFSFVMLIFLQYKYLWKYFWCKNKKFCW